MGAHGIRGAAAVLCSQVSALDDVDPQHQASWGGLLGHWAGAGAAVARGRH